MFEYRGEISSSKSLFNRAQIVQSFFPHLELQGSSKADDVFALKTALEKHSRGETTLDCREAGTAFRFLSFRLSRLHGDYDLRGSERLLQRPQQELIQILTQLGVQAHFQKFENSQSLRLQSKGWTWKNPVLVPSARSSQFASGLLLSAWQLPQTLELKLENFQNSKSYFEMTLAFVRGLGMTVNQVHSNFFEIPPEQKISGSKFRVEMDLSSLFALSCAAIVEGELEIAHFPAGSAQPDLQAFEFLKQMGAFLEVNSVLRVRKTEKLGPLVANVQQCPDVFPVLCALCSWSDGESQIGGAEHLIYKESNRLQKTLELLLRAGVKAWIADSGLVIQGQGSHFQPQVFEFEPDQDHRMAMAAGLFRLREPRIHIKSPEVVTKSFPEFWEILFPKDIQA